MTQALKKRVRALEAKAKPHPKHVYLSLMLAYIGAARAGRTGDAAKEEEAADLRARLEDLAGQLGAQP